MFQFSNINEFKSAVNLVIEENDTVDQYKDDVRAIRILLDRQRRSFEHLLDGVEYLVNASKKRDHYSEQIETLSDKSESVRFGLKTHVNDQKVHLAEN